MEIIKNLPGGMAMKHGSAEMLGEEPVELLSTFSGSPIVKFADGTIVLMPWADIVAIADKYRQEAQIKSTGS